MDSSLDTWNIIEGQDVPAEALATVAKWGRLLRKYWKVRKVQLLFSATGEYLRTATAIVSEEARKRVSRLYPIERR